EHHGSSEGSKDGVESAAGCHLDRGSTEARYIDRRMRPLNWPGQDRQRLQHPMKFSVKGKLLLHPGLAHQLHLLVQTLAALVEGDGKGIVLALVIATASRENRPAITEQIEHSVLFRHTQWLVTGQEHRGRGQFEARRLGRHMGQKHGRRGEAAKQTKMVLGHPGGVETEFLSQERLLQHFAQELLRIASSRTVGRWGIRQGEVAELHGCTLLLKWHDVLRRPFRGPRYAVHNCTGLARPRASPEALPG